MRKFFQRYTPSQSDFKSNPWAGRLGPMLEDPYLFHFNRRSVALAFAIGLALMWLPLPMQTPSAILAALYVRANVPLSAALVWITNPITVPPMYFAAYKLGLRVLGESAPSTAGWSWADFGEIMRSLMGEWKPLFLGCGIMAVISSMIGYYGVKLVWRLLVLRKRNMRRPLTARSKS